MGQTGNMFANEHDLRLPYTMPNAGNPWWQSVIWAPDYRTLTGSFDLTENNMICPEVAGRPIDGRMQYISYPSLGWSLSTTLEQWNDVMNQI